MNSITREGRDMVGWTKPIMSWSALSPYKPPQHGRWYFCTKSTLEDRKEKQVEWIFKKILQSSYSNCFYGFLV
jgi:hypothetical protein